MVETIRFKRDTSFRKKMFTGDSFAHPAKMDSQLLLYLVERYTKPGETILDPMFGSGTCMLACTVGRHVIGVELEEKFIKMSQANWEKVRAMPQLGSSMGTCTIIHGDARNLSGLPADTCLFSPPYAEAQSGGGIAKNGYVPQSASGKKRHPSGKSDADWVSKRSYMPENQGASEGQIGSLPYGDIQAVITSPTYGDNPGTPSLGSVNKDDWGKQGGDIVARRGLEKGYSSNPSNIGNLRYGQIDHIRTSPPYEGIETARSGQWDGEKGFTGDKHHDKAKYNVTNQANIGNLKSSNYLEAMLTVYHECFKVLRPSGLLILVLKNFIRDRTIVRLDLDTIKLCESCGFTLKETLQRELPAQSFWRILYKKKYGITIDFEDVLVFKRESR